jgi:hypothetical protein
MRQLSRKAQGSRPGTVASGVSVGERTRLEPKTLLALGADGVEALAEEINEMFGIIFSA